MKRAIQTLALASALVFSLVACGGSSGDGVSPSGVVQGGQKDAEARETCADARLEQNLSLTEYRAARFDYHLSQVLHYKIGPESEAHISAQQLLEGELPLEEFVDLTPPGGQGKYARVTCLHLHMKDQFIRMEIPTSLISLGYLDCSVMKAGAEQSSSDDSYSTLPPEAVEAIETMESLKEQADSLFGGARLRAQEFLCPQLPA